MTTNRRVETGMPRSAVMQLERWLDVTSPRVLRWWNAQTSRMKIATSTSFQRADAGPSGPAADRLSMMPATSQAYSGASAATSRPIRPWPTNKMRIQVARQPA